MEKSLASQKEAIDALDRAVAVLRKEIGSTETLLLITILGVAVCLIGLTLFCVWRTSSLSQRLAKLEGETESK
jgi:hypothetical protein